MCLCYSFMPVKSEIPQLSSKVERDDVPWRENKKQRKEKFCCSRLLRQHLGVERFFVLFCFINGIVELNDVILLYSVLKPDLSTNFSVLFRFSFDTNKQIKWHAVSVANYFLSFQKTRECSGMNSHLVISLPSINSKVYDVVTMTMIFNTY